MHESNPRRVHEVLHVVAGAMALQLENPTSFVKTLAKMVAKFVCISSTND